MKASHRRTAAKGLVSPLIHVGQFKVDAAQVVDKHHLDVDVNLSNDHESIAKDLCTTADIAEELSEVCDPKRLTCPREEEIIDWEDITNAPVNTGLETVNNWIDVNKLRLQHKTPSTLMKTKHTEYDCHLENKWMRYPAKDETDKIKCPESVITVAINFSRDVRRFKHTTCNFRFLGSQNLIALRDSVPCPLDYQPVGLFTENPDHPQDIKCKDLFKAACLFVENTFYHDHREESPANDLSRPIIEYAKEHGIDIPEDLQELSMENYTFDDLKLCLGRPYTYLHQGNCHHVIIFKDIRLLHKDDCMSKSAYPLSTSRARSKTAVCKVCEWYYARWMTTADEFVDEDPCFFCDTCFRMLHYNKDGSVAGRFQAFPHIPRESVFC